MLKEESETFERINQTNEMQKKIFDDFEKIIRDGNWNDNIGIENDYLNNNENDKYFSNYENDKYKENEKFGNNKNEDNNGQFEE